MASESIHGKLGRVRPPRVHITYEVETGGAPQKVELPFVVGVMGDLSGMPRVALPPLRNRKFVPIDRDTINEVLAKASPRLAIKLRDRLTDSDTQLGVELNFASLSDFEPGRVARQVEPLRKLLLIRQCLSQLLSKLPGNDDLESLLTEVMALGDKARALTDLLN
jgi:type VI secretion system protein ImpB